MEANITLRPKLHFATVFCLVGLVGCIGLRCSRCSSLFGLFAPGYRTAESAVRSPEKEKIGIFYSQTVVTGQTTDAVLMPDATVND